MMTSGYENAFRITWLLWSDSVGHRWVYSSYKVPVMWGFGDFVVRLDKLWYEQLTCRCSETSLFKYFNICINIVQQIFLWLPRPRYFSTSFSRVRTDIVLDGTFSRLSHSAQEDDSMMRYRVQGRYKNAYELINLRARKFSTLYKNRIFQCLVRHFV